MINKIVDPTKVFAELIGTLIYGYGTATSNSNSFAVAGCLYLGMAFTGYISTPQFNPAVTLAMVLRRIFHGEFEIKDSFQFLCNLTAQLIGATLAALLCWATTHSVFYYNIQSSFNHTEGFFAEVIYTAVICATCLTIKRVTESLLLSGVAISMAYLTGNLGVRNITLACFNPALGLCFNFIHYLKDGEHFGNTWIYVFGPFLGSLIGTAVAMVFLKIEDEDIDSTRTKSLEGRIAN
jgi:glycerol uptake facilitator-like aquaporin